MSPRNSLSLLLLTLCLLHLTYSIVDRTYFRYLDNTKGLPISASTQDIESAYRTKLQKINSQSTQQQKAKKLPLLETAYKTLVNSQQRQKYERYGKDYAKHGIKEITSLNPYTQHDSRKGAAMNMKVAVSIEDLYNGTTVKALFETRQACEKCMGTGAETSKNLNTCGVCGGKGFSMVQGRNMYGQPQKFEGICPHCQGSGKQVTKRCPVCQGNKIHDKLKVIDIKIPPKFQGKQLRLKNYGPQQPLGAPSDFVVKIQQIASPNWRRSGDSLFYTMEISLEQSIFGFRKTFTHLSGQQITVERSQITTKETKVNLPGKGFSSNGRLTVEFKINIPNFTDRQLDMWEDFFQKYKL